VIPVSGNERGFTIPLRDAYRAPATKRAKVAVRLVEEFVLQHVKADIVKISPALNEVLWARGIGKPPRRVKVRVNVSEEEEMKVAQVEPAVEREEVKEEG
jgi:large subunit ribosomal protein L31e